MTNPDVIENKISSTRKYLNILDRYRKNSREELENNIDIKGAVERYLYLSIQSTIDLAEAVISYKDFRKPSTMSESFMILNEEGVIDKSLAEKLVRMTGFRNIIAHDYGDLNYDIVFEVLNKDIKDVEEFLNITSAL